MGGLLNAGLLFLVVCVYGMCHMLISPIPVWLVLAFQFQIEGVSS